MHPHTHAETENSRHRSAHLFSGQVMKKGIVCRINLANPGPLFKWFQHMSASIWNPTISRLHLLLNFSAQQSVEIPLFFYIPSFSITSYLFFPFHSFPFCNSLANPLILWYLHFLSLLCPSIIFILYSVCHHFWLFFATLSVCIPLKQLQLLLHFKQVNLRPYSTVLVLQNLSACWELWWQFSHTSPLFILECMLPLCTFCIIVFNPLGYVLSASRDVAEQQHFISSICLVSLRFFPTKVP